jgi:hypothetical protein
MTQRRSFYRIVFPLPERPRVTIGDCAFEVIDISEGGARLVSPVQPPHFSALPETATVTFQGGATLTSTATLQREEDGELVVRFRSNLPYSAIVAEQRRLLALYPPEVLRRQ